ncbi:MAG: phage tail assembly chaperone [Rhodocyclaceae bacterium]|nr:phage tail assembly chaperone [Rhodocyclaceae bacterium]
MNTVFKLKPNPTFKARVPVSVPGEAVSPEIVVEFRALGKKAVVDYFRSLGGKSDAEALAGIVVGWEGVDADYSAETLAQLLDNYPAAAADLFEAYRRELLEAKRKN